MGTLDTKNIALIIPDFDFGGEEKRVVFFANNYTHYFNKVVLLSPSGKSLPYLDPKVKHIEINIRKISTIRKVLNVLKEEKISFFQGHKRATMPFLLLAEKFLPLVSVFNFDNIYLKHNYACSFVTPKHVVYLSDVVKDFYVPYYKNRRNTTINMGGDFYSILPEQEIQQTKAQLGIKDEFVLLSLGRLSEQKNQPLLIDALHTLKDKNFVCLIAGSGPLEEPLRQMVAHYGLEEKIKFLGHRSDIPNLLNVAHVLIQSSVFEGFPNVFIEAASVGLPIISTNVGSSKTLVRENGLLVTSNKVDEIALAISKMQDEYPKFKENALLLRESDYLKQFHKTKMLENYIAYYRSL